MYPKLLSLFGGKVTIYTYSVCIAVGLIIGAVIFRLLSKRLKMSDKAYDFYSFLSILTVVVGFISAYVFQDLYNVMAGKGSNIVNDTKNLFAGKGFKMSGGITFMGGLIGGVGFFILVTFLYTIPRKNRSVRDEFPLMADIASAVILVAHGFGRIGCFFGGCCYGKVTDSPFGINYPVDGVWQVRYPTQLFEALFCFIAFAVFMLLILKTEKRGYMIALYAAVYSVFRFFIEFLRDDYRGGANIGISAYILVKMLWWDQRKNLPAGQSDKTEKK